MTDEHTVQRAAEAIAGVGRLAFYIDNPPSPGSPAPYSLSKESSHKIAAALADAGLLVGSTPPDDEHRQAVIDAATAERACELEVARYRKARAHTDQLKSHLYRLSRKRRAAVDRLAASTTEGTEGTTT